MKPRHEFTARPRRFTSLRRLFLTFCALTALTVPCLGCGDSPGKPGEESGAKADLPEISAFLTKPSDRFLAPNDFHVNLGTVWAPDTVTDHRSFLGFFIYTSYRS